MEKFTQLALDQGLTRDQILILPRTGKGNKAKGVGGRRAWGPAGWAKQRRG